MGPQSSVHIGEVFILWEVKNTEFVHDCDHDLVSRKCLLAEVRLVFSGVIKTAGLFGFWLNVTCAVCSMDTIDFYLKITN